jgi:hypothetical protein
MLSRITDHGRATPLVWLTVDKRTLKNNRSLYEHRVLVRLAELLPPDHQGVRCRMGWGGESPRTFRKNASSVPVAGFFSESRLRSPDSFMPYRNEGMSEAGASRKVGH